jgi:ParB family chromosome partitioning protein
MSLADVRREFCEIPIGLIDDPQLPARATMDEQKLDELVADIRRKGLLQPMIVARTGDRYEVIAGHRRRIACARAGLAAAPCIVYPTKQAALEGVKYSENRFREELNAAEEAMLFAELLERDCGGDVDTLCEQLGEKRSYVEGRLLLFQGDPRVFHALQHGQIPIGVAHELNRCSDDPQRGSFLWNAVHGGSTIAVVRGWIDDWKRSQQLAGGAAAPLEPLTAPAPVPDTNYFRCYCCGRTDNVHAMRPLNVHDHCRLAILDPLLASFRGE